MLMFSLSASTAYPRQETRLDWRLMFLGFSLGIGHFQLGGLQYLPKRYE